jgi:dTDP-4-amino-4,6-dideoxygalactose transaminase
VYSDIDNSLNLNPNLIEEKVNERTSAILPVHTFGNPCDIEAFDEIASRNDIKVIYDAAHCFGVDYKDTSVLNYGDASILSFHATKLFHTVEGGALIVKDEEQYLRAKRLINYGFEAGEIKSIGINGRMHEFSAAMGLAVLDEIDDVMAARKTIWEKYEASLSGTFMLQNRSSNTNNNYHYMPVVFDSEQQRERVTEALNQESVFPRRYFHPSLDTLHYVDNAGFCPVSQDVASRILCLPIFPALGTKEQEKIISLVLNAA